MSPPGSSSASGSPAPGTPPPGSFEAHLDALERVVDDLEGDALSLEASIARYQEGVAHLAACRRILDAAEQRLTELVASPDGGVSETPLVVTGEGLVPGGPPAPSAAPAPRPRRAGRKAERDPSGAAEGGGDDLPF